MFVKRLLIFVWLLLFNVCADSDRGLVITDAIQIIKVPITESNDPIFVDYSVENQGKNICPVAVSIAKRSQKPDGTEILEYYSDDDESGKEEECPFIITTPQAVVHPNDTWKVRLIYNKKFMKPGDLEESYRVIFTEVPLQKKVEEDSADTANTGIRIIRKYTMVLYMRPKKSKAYPELIKTSGPDKDGNYVVQIKNDGTRSIDGEHLDIPVTINGKSYKVSDIVINQDKREPVFAKSQRPYRVNPRILGKSA